MQTICKVKNCNYSNTHTTIYHKCGVCGLFGHGAIECGYILKMRQLEQYYSDKLPYYLHCKQLNCNSRETHTTDTHVCEMCCKFHSIDNCPHNNKFLTRKYEEIHTHLNCPFCKIVIDFNPNDHKLYDIEQSCHICNEHKIDTRLPCGHTMCIKCINTMAKTNDDNIMNDVIDINSAERIFRIKSKNIDGQIYGIIPGGMGSCYYIRRNNIGEIGQVMWIDNQDYHDEKLCIELDKFIKNYKLINL